MIWIIYDIMESINHGFDTTSSMISFKILSMSFRYSVCHEKKKDEFRILTHKSRFAFDMR